MTTTAAIESQANMRFLLRLLARAGFVDLQGLAVDVAAVETGDGGAGFVGVAVLDEAEALRLAARPFGGHDRGDDGAERHRQIVELGVVDLLGEISYVQFHWVLLHFRVLQQKRGWKLRGSGSGFLT